MAPTISIGGIHLNNSNGVPTAGGAATAASTTPFAIRQGWTLQAPEPLPIWGGGPPFVPGRKIAYSSYENVVERIPISVRGSDHENAVTRLQELKNALATVSATTPAVFNVQPTASSTAMVSEVYSAFVREVTERESGLEAWEGWPDIDAEIILTRAPFWGRLSTGETVINAQSINSGSFTASPDSIVAYTTGSGDLIYEGQPLNLVITDTGANWFDMQWYLASIDSVISDATTQTVTTSSTTGASPGTGDTITVGTTLDAKQALKMRLIAECSTADTNADYRIKAYTSANAPAPFYTGPWAQGGGANSVQDAGTIPTNLWHDTGLTTIYLLLEVRSRTGGSITVTLSAFRLVCYYTLCKISGLDEILGPASAGVIHLRQFVETSGRPCLPLRRAEVYTRTSGGVQDYYGRIDGTPPVYISGASLLFYGIGAGLPANSTWSVTATHAPLWKTLRGND